MKIKLTLPLIILLFCSCQKNNNSTIALDSDSLKKQLRNTNESIGKDNSNSFVEETTSYDENHETTSQSGEYWDDECKCWINPTVENHYEPQETSFTCDDPALIESVQAKLGSVQNIMTTAKNDELKTCDCEAYAPNYRYLGTEMIYAGNTLVPKQKFKYGSKIVYKAQKKDTGEIVWNGNAQHE